MHGVRDVVDENVIVKYSRRYSGMMSVRGERILYIIKRRSEHNKLRMSFEWPCSVQHAMRGS